MKHVLINEDVGTCKSSLTPLNIMTTEYLKGKYTLFSTC